VPIAIAVVATWIAQPAIAPLLPEGALTDGTIAIFFSLLLFIAPDGTGRPLLVWKEADKAPWAVIMLFGGGLALAAAISESGLAAWLGVVLAPLGGMPMIVLALIIVALTILVTEFASNVATASGIMPVLTALIAATGADPILLALPVAMAASWGFMLPSGTGPNALAWATGHIALPRMLKAGLILDVIGAPLLVGMIWMIATIAR
jgi:sodium-dependent dicarboxylate transporter 2/3/5